MHASESTCKYINDAGTIMNVTLNLCKCMYVCVSAKDDIQYMYV